MLSFQLDYKKKNKFIERHNWILGKDGLGKV